MTYFFVLGTNTALSLAELAAVIPLKQPRLFASDLLVAETGYDFVPEELMKRLGGTIKIGLVRKTLSASGQKADHNTSALIDAARQTVLAKQIQVPEGKFNFGFSDYGRPVFNKKDLGIKLKNDLKAAGRSARFVISREKTLSSVVVTQNHMLTRGVEIVLAATTEELMVGETLAVQPFKDLSRRDYGRPVRDDLSGMLPPKLAMVMINLAQVTDENLPLADPFCGSGTILSEAALRGYKNLFGSDISPKAIADTRQNFSWTKELYKIENVRIKLFRARAEELGKVIQPGSLAAIITEPYLGPQRGQINFALIISNLEALYGDAIKGFHSLLRPGGRVVMVWPSYYGQRPIAPDYAGFKIVDMIPAELAKAPAVKTTTRGTIVYGRPGQKVFREIVVLEKI